MLIRPKTQAQFYQVLAITFFWVLCGAFLALYKCVTYDIVTSDFIFIVPKQLPLLSYMLINLIGPFIGGLIGGGILILILNERLHDKSYGYFLIVTTLFFFVFVFLLNTGVSYFFYYKAEITSSEHPLKTARLLLLDPYAIRNILTWMIISFLTLQGLKVYEKYGPGILIAMLLGKYHRPHEVRKVFMFLDLTDSTTIAERLGHVHFFDLLNDFYMDITDPILNSRGEIYQFIGDEVVISWPIRKAISKGLNCIACFYSIEKTIRQREKYYIKKYGLLPTFKAAVHEGTVVVGEMGVIKREIVYSGDILNTTSRMLEQCKFQDQQLIISHDIVALIPEGLLDPYTLDALGRITLRGKLQTVVLYGVKSKSMP